MKKGGTALSKVVVLLLLLVILVLSFMLFKYYGQLKVYFLELLEGFI